MDIVEQLVQEVISLKARLARLETQEQLRFVPLTSRLLSDDFWGDSFSTTAKTLIDLSVSFGAPAGIKAVLMTVSLRDSGSASATCDLILGPTNAPDVGVSMRCTDNPNDHASYYAVIVPCDANGDIYYQTYASGVNTLDLWLAIWGYWI